MDYHGMVSSANGITDTMRSAQAQATAATVFMIRVPTPSVHFLPVGLKKSGSKI